MAISKKILLTGGASVIGSAVVRHFMTYEIKGVEEKSTYSGLVWKGLKD